MDSVSRRRTNLLSDYLAPPSGMAVDFTAPAGAPALFAPDSVTWRIMKNPISLTIGGVAAVILELAEPRVRTGVWEHTSFRRDPATRIQRTGYAAMVTVYAPAEAARAMISGVNAAHARIGGETPEGAPYRADDEELLNWVQATASFGFIEAYDRFVRPLSPQQRDQAYAEGAPAAALYGAKDTPCSAAEMDALFAAMAAKLERSDIVFEFLDIMRAAPLLPSRTLQRMMVRAAVELAPDWLREKLGLDARHGLRVGEHALLKALGAAADRIVLAEAPPAQACVRMGLARNYLYR
jgi:uncharacterized protein (DUF2236 family)